MRPADITMKRGDTRPDVLLTPLDGNGNVVNMVDAPLGPLVSKTFHLADAAGTVVLEGNATVEGAGPVNRLRYRWGTGSATETEALRGEYRGEFEVTYADGGRETFPNGRDLKIVFGEDVETGAEP